jgi:hypothetical protein
LIAKAYCEGVMQIRVPRHLEARLPTITVLIVDDDYYMRKVVRTMLTAVGVVRIYEARMARRDFTPSRKSTPTSYSSIGKCR